MLLRDVLKPALSCTEVTGLTVEECVACARSAASQIRGGWLRILGAPDYRAYLAHHAANHAASRPLGERELSPAISTTGTTGEALGDAVDRLGQSRRSGDRVVDGGRIDIGGIDTLRALGPPPIQLRAAFV
jgi:hypothetical protein